MAIKILILGGSGMAGHMVHYYLQASKKFSVSSTFFSNRSKFTTKQLDVHDAVALRELVANNQPDYIVNCVGALIRQSKSDPKSTIYLNSYFPHLLRQVCDSSSSRLIHLSTDCVFAGSRGSYREKDQTDALDVYGKSKSLGELDVNQHLTIRTSIIGPELKSAHEGLFNWFMAQKGTIKGYSQAYWSGITTLQLAKSIETSIENDLSGLLQVTNGIPISKFELLKVFKNVFTKEDVEILPNADYKVDKSLAPSERFDFKVPDYVEMVKQMKVVMNSSDYKEFIA
jgi:dTDP-4-dehydrorhamnose reductase